MKLKTTSLEMSLLKKINTHIDSTYPQISFDQMFIMLHQHNEASSNTAEYTDPHNPPPMNIHNICNSIINFHSKENLTRYKLLYGED